jgi:hypothetical protein
VVARWARGGVGMLVSLVAGYLTDIQCQLHLVPVLVPVPRSQRRAERCSLRHGSMLTKGRQLDHNRSVEQRVPGLSVEGSLLRRSGTRTPTRTHRNTRTRGGPRRQSRSDVLFFRVCCVRRAALECYTQHRGKDP